MNWSCENLASNSPEARESWVSLPALGSTGSGDTCITHHTLGAVNTGEARPSRKTRLTLEARSRVSHRSLSAWLAGVSKVSWRPLGPVHARQAGSSVKAVQPTVSLLSILARATRESIHSSVTLESHSAGQPRVPAEPSLAHLPDHTLDARLTG